MGYPAPGMPPAISYSLPVIATAMPTTQYDMKKGDNHERYRHRDGPAPGRAHHGTDHANGGPDNTYGTADQPHIVAARMRRVHSV